jgi:hypothetical protein
MYDDREEHIIDFNGQKHNLVMLCVMLKKTQQPKKNIL